MGTNTRITLQLDGDNVAQAWHGTRGRGKEARSSQGCSRKGDQAAALLRAGGCPQARLQKEHRAPDEAQVVHRAGNRAHPARRKVQGEARRLSQTARVGTSARLRAVHGERRAAQSYVIATSTKIDISKVSVDAGLNDAFFKAADKKASKEFFEGDAEVTKKELPAEVKAAQKKVDDQLMPLVEKVKDLKGYLATRFTLSKGVYPHTLKF